MNRGPPGHPIHDLWACTAAGGSSLSLSGSFHGTNEDISVGCDATRRLNRKDVIPWDASPSGLIVKHAHQSFHNWNATGRKEGRKELCIWSHIISSSIFPIKCMWCRVRWRPGFPRQTISLLDRYWTSRRRRRHFIRIKGSHLNLWLD